MSKIKTTFDDLWKKGLENDARSLGVIDGDLPKVRSKVKNVLIRAGWATAAGDVDFVTDMDAANALQAARKELNRVSERLVAERKVVRASKTPGMAPTKAQVLNASAESLTPGPQQVHLESTQHAVEASFLPKMAQVGDRCPRCHGSMTPVGLANSRGGLYCTKDRVVVPLSADTQVRY